MYLLLAGNDTVPISLCRGRGGGERCVEGHPVSQCFVNKLEASPLGPSGGLSRCALGGHRLVARLL